MPDDSIWDEETPLGEQIDETMRRRKEAGLERGESFSRKEGGLSERGGATPEAGSVMPEENRRNTDARRADLGARSLDAPRSESVIKTPADVPAEVERVKKGRSRNVDLEWLMRRAGKK